MGFKTSWDRYLQERREAGEEDLISSSPRPRSKLSDTRVVSAGHHWYHGISGSAVSAHSYYTGRYRGEKYSLNDVITPNWKILQSQGRIINNPVSSSKEIWNRWQDSFAFRYTAGLVTEEVLVDGYGSAAFEYDNSPYVFDEQATLVDTDFLEYKAKVDTLGSIVPPQALVHVTARELGKTIAMVANRARRIAECISIMRDPINPGTKYKRLLKAFGVTSYTRGIPRSPSKHSSSIHQLWLEWRYGWGPLVYDIEGLLKAAFVTRQEFNPRATARGFAHDSQTRTRSFSFYYLNSPGLGSFTGTEQLLHEAVLRGYCLYDRNASQIGPNAFGVYSIPESLWELTPYSFVIDKFVNIGNFLAAATPKVGVNYLASGFTKLDKKSYKRTITGYTNGAPWKIHVSPVGRQETLINQMFRRVTSLEVPMYPRVEVKLNAKHALDAIALLQNLKR